MTRKTERRRTAFRWLPALLAAITVGGCASGPSNASLRTRSLGDDPVVLGSRYPTAVYGAPSFGVASIMLTDVPVETLLDGTARSGQIVHLELLWSPKAGSTPMDASATNVRIHHVIIAEGEVGVYGGAGFALPVGTPGESALHLTVEDATVRLLESTDGFVDLLTPARVTGSLTARHDPTAARRLQVAVSQFVTDVLGETRFVEGRADATSIVAARP